MKKYDVVVIGGGPAGMFAAITAASRNHSVLLLEKMRSVGRKLSITGKGRCNLTNAIFIDDFISNIPGNGKFLYHAFHQFDNQDLLDFFHKRGVETKVERGERIFPVSDDAMQIVNTLKKALEQAKVDVMVNQNVKKIIVQEKQVKAIQLEQGEQVECENVILATGGKSYPMTGSNGYGYEMAKELGHKIVEPRASLVPMEIMEKVNLQGLSLKNVELKVWDGSKVCYEDFGEMLFTHFGVSGPIILSASSHILRLKDIEKKMQEGKIQLQIDLKPALSEEKLDARIQRDFAKNTRKQFKNALNDLLPSKMIPEMIKLSRISPEKQVDQITREERIRLVTLFKNLRFTVKKFRPIEEAIVTAGGICIKEICAKTMESKLISGLYFAGEIIDADAYTGGFNLQIAFSTGYVAGLLQKE